MTPNPYAAEWRDDDGHAVASVYAGTMCRNPRYPRDLAARTGDGRFEHALPCRECDGCLKYQELQLRIRLADHFGKSTEALWLIHISAPLDDHGRIMRLASRTLSSCELLGFCRAGAIGFVLIVSGRPPRKPAMRGLRRYVSRLVRVVDPTRKRAWRDATRGVAISRSEYGAWKKRFYFRGLPQIEREKFTLEKRGGIRKRHPEAKIGFRAWRDGLTLYAPARLVAADLFRVMGLKRLAAAAASPVNRRRPQAAVPGSAMTGFRDVAGAHGATGDPSTQNMAALKHAPASTSFPRPDVALATAGRDAGSYSPQGAFAFAWGERMVKRARERGG